MGHVRSHHGRGTFSVFAILGLALLMLFLIQAAGFAFLELGIPLWIAILIVPGSLFGSVVNIPLYKVKSDPTPCTQNEYFRYYGVTYRVFHPKCPGETQISINFGGAIIPISVSTYLILLNPEALLQFVIAIVVVTFVVHKIARVEPNVGILTPAFLPPITAVLTTLAIIFLLPGLYNIYAIAYVCGTLGTLLGADILNLGKLPQMRSNHASIGGAGTWDGVFLTGILAVFIL